MKDSLDTAAVQGPPATQPGARSMAGWLPAGLGGWQQPPWGSHLVRGAHPLPLLPSWPPQAPHLAPISFFPLHRASPGPVPGSGLFWSLPTSPSRAPSPQTAAPAPKTQVQCGLGGGGWASGSSSPCWYPHDTSLFWGPHGLWGVSLESGGLSGGRWLKNLGDSTVQHRAGLNEMLGSTC